MHKKALLALMLVMTMLLSGCALIQKNEEVDRATVIVSAGEYAYTKGEILDMVDSQLMYNQQMYGMYGMYYDPTDPANIADSRTAVVDYYTELAAKNIQAKKLGLDVFTEEEEAEIKANADANWEGLRQQVMEGYFADTTLTDDALTAAVDEKMTELGLNYADYDLFAREEKMHEKLREETVKGVAVTDEELQLQLDMEIENARMTYAEDPTAFGVDSTYGYTVYYRPAGYRYAKQILVTYLPEDQAIIDALETKLTAASDTVATLRETLTGMGVEPALLVGMVDVTMAEPAGVASGTDLIVAEQAEVAGVETSFDPSVTEEVAELVKQLATAEAEADFYAQQLDNAEANGLAHIDAKTDEIIALVTAEGADWDALMAQYTEDPGMQEGSVTAATGYAVCADMAGSVMDEAFVNAAMALEKVGDVSAKTPGMYGYYIIQYAGDVQEGAVTLEEVRTELTDTLLATRQDEVWQAALDQWIKEANVKVDMKSLER